MTTLPPISSARRRAGVLLAVCALAPAVLPATASALPTLEHGDRGRSVERLQHGLHIGADGVFGRGTVRAVKRFQRRHGLHADGVVGGATWRMLRRSLHRRRAVARSAGAVTGRGSSVRRLQDRLGVAADGVFGPGTARAVKRFQRDHGLTADGVVGPATWSALGIGGALPVLKRTRLRGVHPGSGLPAAVSRAIAAANRIAGRPYRFGGGHRSFSDSGYDCSGSVSYVLHGAGRLGSPLDSSALMSYGAAGAGRWITIYANPGHAYMVIRGRRYDTTGRSESGSRWQQVDRSSAGYVVRHPPGL
jgi:peptidoglycan hydrolase-like protein with peptidoglycan-binding domain